MKLTLALILIASLATLIGCGTREKPVFIIDYDSTVGIDLALIDSMKGTHTIYIRGFSQGGGGTMIEMDSVDVDSCAFDGLPGKGIDLRRHYSPETFHNLREEYIDTTPVKAQTIKP